MKLSIIIPVYNEEKTIVQLLKRVNDVKLTLKIKKEVIVIDDGSTDRTEEFLLNSRFENTKIFVKKFNQGKGSAIREGFKIATGEILIVQDADLEYDPNDFSKLIKPILEGKCEVVYGSRFINYPLILVGKNRTPLPTHWIGNKFLVMVTNFLYGSNLTDMETCYKVLSKNVLKKLDLKGQRFEIEPEITAQILKNKFKITEIPIQIKPRTHDEGKKISWRDGFIALWILLKYRFI